MPSSPPSASNEQCGRFACQAGRSPLRELMHPRRGVGVVLDDPCIAFAGGWALTSVARPSGAEPELMAGPRRSMQGLVSTTGNGVASR